MEKDFYLASIREQAVKWCGKFVRRGKEGVISNYMLDEDLFQRLKVLQFDIYSEEWLEFILAFGKRLKIKTFSRFCAVINL
ncbi:DUF3990 domain-containing protein [Oribacterium asaccharolyticum]|uniref:DUF3990 domain-containing protein n=1 Tax=Oribacterium asaccharolyticum TaxID=1501332 RepID=UPI0028EE2DC1|nr:DUF3990 domain-containing protein [Oribacterium asaccharolyticum]